MPICTSCGGQLSAFGMHKCSNRNDLHSLSRSSQKADLPKPGYDIFGQPRPKEHIHAGPPFLHKCWNCSAIYAPDWLNSASAKQGDHYHNGPSFLHICRACSAIYVPDPPSPTSPPRTTNRTSTTSTTGGGLFGSTTGTISTTGKIITTSTTTTSTTGGGAFGSTTASSGFGQSQSTANMANTTTVSKLSTPFTFGRSQPTTTTSTTGGGGFGPSSGFGLGPLKAKEDEASQDKISQDKAEDKAEADKTSQDKAEDKAEADKTSQDKAEEKAEEKAEVDQTPQDKVEEVGKISQEKAEEVGGKTALHLAAQAGQWHIVKSLVEKGADIGAKTNDGKVEEEKAGASSEDEEEEDEDAASKDEEEDEDAASKDEEEDEDAASKDEEEESVEVTEGEPGKAASPRRKRATETCSDGNAGPIRVPISSMAQRIMKIEKYARSTLNATNELKLLWQQGRASRAN
ncbi:MAG: hypothetical protein E6Q06_01790 [Candidatus Moraniibacteriota bacterium]|nr:MAG: hypothetical protein E6Q06_01790 [Candidatus Moranbacteria bacterium]